MTKTVELIFDFASPNAYMVHKVLPGIAARHGAEVYYNPCLLGGIFKATNNVAPFVAFKDIKGKHEYHQLEGERFIKKHGLTAYKMNPHFPITTVLILRGLLAAEEAGVKDKYIDAIITAMWEREENTGDPETVTRILNEAGLDGEALVAKTQDPAIKQKLIDNTNAAVERGVFGIPTFFVGNEMFFGKERLDQVEEELAK